ncbi:yippee-domain-containing protein, partial [Cucurbitaria berberidis CBS 394.84]
NSPTTPFPLYLLPSIPFRRRRSSAISTSTASTASPSASPPQPTSFLSNNPTSHLRCQKCLTDLIPTSSIISKGFTGRHGRAYLVAPPPPSTILAGGALAAPQWTKDDLPNTLTHKPAPRQLVTGAHTVSDISCRSCGVVLGWKYVEAEEDSQKYKVGKFILETKRVVKGAEWESRDLVPQEEEGQQGRAVEDKEDEDIQFDSQDEEECEDLFSGIWSPQLARRRRKNRAFG